MRIKTKVTLGVIFLFGVTLAIGGLALYHLDRLSMDARSILDNNYETLEYTKGILDACEDMPLDSAKALKAMQDNLLHQEGNVTEPGEQELTVVLKSAVENLRKDPSNEKHLKLIREQVLAIQELNMRAIVRKNEITQQTAEQATMYLVVIGTIFTLISFAFIVNFPGYVANPITRLTSSIKAIANKDYEERLVFDRKDEFEELATAFNSMAEKLDEYEHSNLAKLLFEKKRIETIINRMHDPIIGLDENRRVLFANTEALELLNIREEDLIARYAPDVALTNDLLRNMIQERDADKETKGEGVIKIFADKKESYFSREIIPISFTPTGEKESVFIGNVVLLRNITSFKEHDLAKTNFIATVSHELKTPIASLQMGVKLLQDERVGNLNDEQQRIVQTIRDETGRLLKITGELLDLAQVETGNIKLALQSTDPVEVLDNALDAVKFQADQQHVKIEKVTDGEFDLVRMDKDKTTWVLINFLTNAIRHNPENSRVTVALKRTAHAITFSVRDFGAGIEPKHLERLFDRYYQVPAAGSRKGTGLGLSISKEFIEAQGGTISAESELGKGSMFSFSFNV